MTIAEHYPTVHSGDIYSVTGLFGIRAYSRAPYRPVPLCHGDICIRCWMRYGEVLPVSSRLCRHGGAS